MTRAAIAAALAAVMVAIGGASVGRPFRAGDAAGAKAPAYEGAPAYENVPAYENAPGDENAYVGRPFRAGDDFDAAVDPLVDGLWAAYDTNAAMADVRFISQYWRLAANHGYNATIERIRERLTKAGLTVRVEEYPAGAPGWDHSLATLAVAQNGKPDEVVLSREKDRLALCINSFSTPDGGLLAPLIDVGRGDREEDYAGKSIKGAVVLGDADVSQLWRRAVTGQGAIGVISTALPAYLNADPPGAKPTPRDQWDILQWSSVPYDEARKAFGFKASPRAAATLRKRLAAAGSAGVSVHVAIASSFTTGAAKTLVAEIPGVMASSERIVMAAHVQEPGANDNASGVATLAELAVSMSAAIRQKKIAAPGRTLTFLFLNEISGSRRWLQDHPAKLVKYMFSLDMTGEDIAKTGGSFLVERYPDPGAVWERPWDRHSEWGKGNVRAESLTGDLINDAHLAVATRVARKSKWVIKTNPYEGGSDHTVFGQAGIPSLLDWHFTDRYYHTNFDTPDKTSPEEMRNVGVSVGATVLLFASAGEKVALEIAKVVADAGRARIALEEREGAKLAAASADKTSAQTREATILSAWKKWYGEAVRSASRLLTGPPTLAFRGEIDRLASEFESRESAGGIPPMFGLAAQAGLQQRPAVVIENPPNSSAIFVCGTDHKLPNPIPLRPTTLILAGDGRALMACTPGVHTQEDREAREAAVLARGLSSPAAEIRWRAAQALARIPKLLSAELAVTSRTQTPRGIMTTGTMVPLEDNLGDLVNAIVVRTACREVQTFGSVQVLRWQPGRLFQLLRDSSPDVQKEAAYAIGTRLSAPGRPADLYTAAFNEIQSCFAGVKSDEVRGLLLEAIGVAAYATNEQREAAETLLADQANGSIEKVLGASRGLEALIRQDPRRAIQPTTRDRLRQLATYGLQAGQPEPGDPRTSVRLLAVQALMTAGDTDIFTLRRASQDDDWQVRRIIAGRLDVSNEAQANIAAQLAFDPAFQVRYDLVASFGRQAARTGKCAALSPFLTDPAPVVVMRVIDSLSPACSDLEPFIEKLTAFADSIQDSTSTAWQIPARALTGLARLKPEAAKARLENAVKDARWEVRAAAVSVAATLGDSSIVEALGRDPHPNVQTAALDALFRLKSASVVPLALETLQEGRDFQLLMTAARVLKGLPQESKNAATETLLATLRRLTLEASDMSRDPRVAILERLAETMVPERSTDLLPFTLDFDDVVLETARKTFAALVSAEPPTTGKTRRYPFQPPESLLQSLPTTALIQLENGSVELKLLPDVAPVTVARFATLVRAGEYNGKTFHRVVPNFVVQGGSPGANEYAGVTPRFMRDEVGPQARHVRGAVGISTRGDDTGDGQIFIDLVDLPRLDRHYTVFAHVTNGMEFVDAMLEGAKILNVTVR